MQLSFLGLSQNHLKIKNQKYINYSIINQKKYYQGLVSYNNNWYIWIYVINDVCIADSYLSYKKWSVYFGYNQYWFNCRLVLLCFFIWGKVSGSLFWRFFPGGAANSFELDFLKCFLVFRLIFPAFAINRNLILSRSDEAFDQKFTRSVDS